MPLLIFFRRLVSNTFSNLETTAFIITGFISSNKEVKQVVSINHNWISSILQRNNGQSTAYSPKKIEWVIVNFFPQKEEFIMRDLLVIVVYFCASQYKKHYDRRNKQE